MSLFLGIFMLIIGAAGMWGQGVLGTVSVVDGVILHQTIFGWLLPTIHLNVLFAFGVIGVCGDLSQTVYEAAT